MKLQTKNKSTLYTELFYLSVIVLACFKVAYAISDAMDVLFYDESIYLYKGLHLGDFLFKDGFLYFCWYKFLSFFTPDSISLYYTNYLVLTLLNPFLIYALLRKLKVQPFISALFSLLFLVSNMNITSWPFITRFALAWILSILIIMVSVKSNRIKFVVSLMGLSLLVYIRPEYFLSLILFSLCAIVFLLFRYRKSRNRVVLVYIILTIFISGLVILIKNPARSGRTSMAFGQHYAIHLNLIGKVTVNPSTNWKQIMKDNFGTHESVMQAFLNNPREMIRHIIYNLKLLPYQTSRHAFPYSKEQEVTVTKKIIWAGFIILFLVLIIKAIKRKIRQPLISSDSALTNETIFYFLALILLIPLTISISIVFPREHYLLVIFAFILLISAKNIPPIPEKFRWQWIQYPIMLILLYFCPWQVSGNSGLLPGKYISLHQQECTNIKRIQFLNQLKTTAHKVLLSTGGSMELYVNNLTHVDEQTKKIPFNAFLKEQKINVIRLNYGLITDTRFAKDKEFKKFLTLLPNEEWVKIPIPGCNEEVAIRRDILPDEEK